MQCRVTWWVGEVENAGANMLHAHEKVSDLRWCRHEAFSFAYLFWHLIFSRRVKLTIELFMTSIYFNPLLSQHV